MTQYTLFIKITLIVIVSILFLFLYSNSLQKKDETLHVVISTYKSQISGFSSSILNSKHHIKVNHEIIYNKINSTKENLLTHDSNFKDNIILSNNVTIDSKNSINRNVSNRIPNNNVITNKVSNNNVISSNVPNNNVVSNKNRNINDFDINILSHKIHINGNNNNNNNNNINNNNKIPLQSNLNTDNKRKLNLYQNKAIVDANGTLIIPLGDTMKQHLDIFCPKKCRDNIEDWKRIQNNDTVPDDKVWAASVLPSNDGLCNRQLGMISTLALAIISKRVFTICGWDTIYNYYDLPFKKRVVKCGGNGTYLHKYMNWNEIRLAEREKSFNSKDRIFIVQTQGIILRHWLRHGRNKLILRRYGFVIGNMTDLEIMSTMYYFLHNEIMTVNKSIREKADAITKDWDDWNVLGLQIRTGKDADFKNDRKVDMLRDLEKNYFPSFAEKYASNPTVRFAIISDSTHVKQEYIKKYPGRVYYYNGTIEHARSEYGKEYSLAMEATFIDIEIMSKTRYIRRTTMSSLGLTCQLYNKYLYLE
ncbi:hypothetical protein WA158_008060 [Blastocystis sp. Blastoise]